MKPSGVSGRVAGRHANCRNHGVILLLGLALPLAGCNAKKEAPATAESDRAKPSDQAPPPPTDAAPSPPSETQARELVQEFAEAIFASDYPRAIDTLRVPESLSETQVLFFVKELRNRGHLTKAGVVALEKARFGSLEERMGEDAPTVASDLGLPMKDLYCLGNSDSAVVFTWEDQRLRIAAIHDL